MGGGLEVEDGPWPEAETRRRRTEAGGELVEGEESVAVGVQGLKDVVQLLGAERKPPVQPLLDDTQHGCVRQKTKAWGMLMRVSP